MVQIDGKWYSSYVKLGTHKTDKVQLITKTVDIKHNSNGSKTVKVGVNFDFKLKSPKGRSLGKSMLRFVNVTLDSFKLPGKIEDLSPSTVSLSNTLQMRTATNTYDYDKKFSLTVGNKVIDITDLTDKTSEINILDFTKYRDQILEGTRCFREEERRL